MKNIGLKSKKINQLIGMLFFATVIGVSACSSETEEANETIAVEESADNTESTAMTKEESVTEEPSELTDDTMPDNTHTDDKVTDSAENTNVDKTAADGLQ